MSPPPDSIDGVIASLDDIVLLSRAEESRLGYFAALYRKVTRAVKKGIADGLFDDGERMERLDVIFARRYLDAYQQYRANQQVTASWRHAFDASGRWSPIVLQHLLLGMNAHINLDLGIAAAETLPGDSIDDLHDDFQKINGILASLTADVQQDLSEVWIALRLLNRFLGRMDDEIIGFSMTVARDEAWSLAQQLAPLSESERATRIASRDASVGRLAEHILSPGSFLTAVTFFVRLGERGSIPHIIDVLE